MTFEEELMNIFKKEIKDALEKKIKYIKRYMRTTAETFPNSLLNDPSIIKEKFPSLQNKVFWSLHGGMEGGAVVQVAYLDEYCLDRQRVREAIEKIPLKEKALMGDPSKLAYLEYFSMSLKKELGL